MNGIEIISGDLELLSQSTGNIGDDLSEINCNTVSTHILQGMPGSTSLSLAPAMTSTISAIVNNLSGQLFEFSVNISTVIAGFHESDAGVSSAFNATATDSQLHEGTGKLISTQVLDSTPLPSTLFDRIAERLG